MYPIWMYRIGKDRLDKGRGEEESPTSPNSKIYGEYEKDEEELRKKTNDRSKAPTIEEYMIGDHL